MTNPTLTESPFLQACSGIKPHKTPIWLNRQAGRYMPEYKQVKGKTPSLAFFKSPEQSAQVAIDAQKILTVDAAILFTDLLPILEPMGLKLDYLEGKGPVIENPIRTNQDIESLAIVESKDSMSFIEKTIELTLQGLPSNIPLIGFSGAPFTLATYAIEGGTSRHHLKTKQFMIKNPVYWEILMDKLTCSLVDYALHQIESGVHAFQIFDTWAGILSYDLYEKYIFPHTKNLIHQISGKVPIIYFGIENQHLLPLINQYDISVIATDWKTSFTKVPESKTVQGNLDPAILFSTIPAIIENTQNILKDGKNRPHIFNLGHGIMPETPVDHVKALVNYVHEYSHHN